MPFLNMWEKSLNYVVHLRIIMDLSETRWCYLKVSSFSVYVASCHPKLFVVM